MTTPERHHEKLRLLLLIPMLIAMRPVKGFSRQHQQQQPSPPLSFISPQGGRTKPTSQENIITDNENVSTATNCRSSRRELLESATRNAAGLVVAAASSGALFSASPPPPALALTPQQAAKDYDTYASSYDTLDGGVAASALGLDEARRQLLYNYAAGDVLEIGAGTGLNLEFYDWTKIKSLTLVDISPGMLSQCQVKWQSIKQQLEQQQQQQEPLPPVRFVTADATNELVTTFGPESFDTVVDTFSLCVMGNEGAVQCMQQLRDVVRNKKENGQLLLLENTRSDNPLLGKYQDVTAQAAASVGGKGCVYNQNVGQILRNTNGLVVTQEVSYASGLFRAFRVQRI